MHSMHLHGDSNLHTKKKERPSSFTLIGFTFLSCTTNTKELLMSHSILVELVFIDKNKKCEENTMVVWKIKCYILILPCFSLGARLVFKYTCTNRIGKKTSIQFRNLHRRISKYLISIFPRT